MDNDALRNTPRKNDARRVSHEHNVILPVNAPNVRVDCANPIDDCARKRSARFPNKNRISVAYSDERHSAIK